MKGRFMKEASKFGKVAHNLGMSTRFGGTLFGQVSLNPSVSSISDRSERGRVLNEAWARFQAVNLPAVLSTLLGWRLGGVREDAELRALGLTHAKDLLLGGAPSTRSPRPCSGRRWLAGPQRALRLCALATPWRPKRHPAPRVPYGY
jgi:hypothetical protein